MHRLAEDGAHDRYELTWWAHVKITYIYTHSGCRNIGKRRNPPTPWELQACEASEIEPLALPWSLRPRPQEQAGGFHIFQCIG